jgi:DNA processing protein
MDLDEILTIPLGDPRYPAALAAIHDPPPILWTRGRAESLYGPMVAVVGSRAASPYALQVARKLGADLARRKVTVVSGMARGVDSAAHEGALDGGGVTVAVFGCGIDIIYPREHAALAARIRAAGALLSEFPPDTPPLPAYFPQRNRIISGLALAVVIVEAAEKSGSLITARFALDQGREVLAVPGNILSGRNSGAHALLRDGAKIVEGVDDILEEIQRGIRDFGTRESGVGIRQSGCGAEGSNTVDSASQDPVLLNMAVAEPYDLDELAALSGMDRITLLSRLLELELAGAVQRVDGGRFVRSRMSC